MVARDWIPEHRRIVGMSFLTLAALNGWISHTIYLQHPCMLVANAPMAGALVLGVILTSWAGGSIPR